MAENVEPYLIIFHPDNTSTTYQLAKIEKLTVGYGANTTLRLEGDQTISRVQIELIREGNYLFLSNCSMSRQTFLNNKSLAFNERVAVPLRHNDEIRFGKYRLLFQDEEDTLYRSPEIDQELLPAQAAITSELLTPSQTRFYLKGDKVYYKSREAKLTPKPYQLMECLFQHYPEMCSNQKLQDTIFLVKYDEMSKEYKSKGDLHRLVSETRAQLIAGLGEEGRNLLLTNHGFGYTLILD